MDDPISSERPAFCRPALCSLDRPRLDEATGPTSRLTQIPQVYTRVHVCEHPRYLLTPLGTLPTCAGLHNSDARHTRYAQVANDTDHRSSATRLTWFCFILQDYLLCVSSGFPLFDLNWCKHPGRGIYGSSENGNFANGRRWIGQGDNTSMLVSVEHCPTLSWFQLQHIHLRPLGVS